MRKKPVTLALQGGGSHGAFTWGVLDRLLEDERIEVEGISGASAGAINAVVLAHGLTAGGREGARRALETFWRSVASGTPPGRWAAFDNPPSREPGPAVNALLFLSRFLSPDQLNPFNLNPLREILSAQIDFAGIRAECGIKLFVAATRVATGEPRLFCTGELTLEAVLASACLPALNRPVEIDGEAYWDGGLTANPPLQPLVYQCDARDILMVLLDPLRSGGTFATAADIAHRLTEISFGSTLASELKGIALAKKEAERSLIPMGRLERRLRRLNLHLIGSHDFMSRLSLLSRLNTEVDFIEALRKEGRSRAAAWLRRNFRLIGERSSFALAALQK